MFGDSDNLNRFEEKNRKRKGINTEYDVLDMPFDSGSTYENGSDSLKDIRVEKSNKVLKIIMVIFLLLCVFMATVVGITYYKYTVNKTDVAIMSNIGYEIVDYEVEVVEKKISNYFVGKEYVFVVNGLEKLEVDEIVVEKDIYNYYRIGDYFEHGLLLKEGKTATFMDYVKGYIGYKYE